MDIKINFLWLNDELTDVEMISLNSFLRKGYVCYLWTYNEIKNVPENIIVKDANKIIPYVEMCPRTFSDYFRYKLLYKYGGWWSDIDNVCINILPEDSTYVFVEYLGEFNNHLMKCPKNSVLLKSIITDIENSTIHRPSGFWNFDYLKSKKDDHFLSKVLILPHKEGNVFSNNEITKLMLEEIDWKTYSDSYNIHLFKSEHRACMTNNDIYKLNLDNLKKYINA